MAVIEQAPAGPIIEDTPPTRSGLRRALRIVAFLSLMVAFGVGGYVGWLLWGTGLQTAAAQDDLRGTFEAAVERPDTGTAAEDPLPGNAYAQIQIPAIGVDFIVVEGTDYEALKEGPGHYAQTADPWDDSGRVAIAGHRTTYLHPFLELDRLAKGDDIVLRTPKGTFTYDITRVFVIPSEGSGKVLTQTRQPSLVLTTCHPKYSAEERLIVTANLIDGSAAAA